MLVSTPIGYACLIYGNYPFDIYLYRPTCRHLLKAYKATPKQPLAGLVTAFVSIGTVQREMSGIELSYLGT